MGILQILHGLVERLPELLHEVTTNWLKPLKFPGCAARTRRIEQPELPSNDRSCMGHANFLLPTTPIS
jgi:hypothetical protein